jgi:hypothetical protein
MIEPVVRCTGQGERGRERGGRRDRRGKPHLSFVVLAKEIDREG